MKKSKAKSKKNTHIEIPKGYKVIANGGMTETHDFEKHPILEGEVLEIKTLPPKFGEDKKGKKIEVRKETRLMVLKTKTGDAAVWEKKALENLFDQCEVGSDVHIHYTGRIEIKGRDKGMHTFVCGLKQFYREGSHPPFYL